jgi:hypothetical protein
MSHVILPLATLLAFVLGLSAAAQDPVTIAERFDTSIPYRVELQVRLSGRLAIAPEKGKPPQVLPMIGSSTLIYDERVLSADEPRTSKVIRSYRDVTFDRTVSDREQKADVRPAVRRMVVLRSERGKKAPFSPDGPLTWGEIDVVRTDLFSPVLVPGLLPPRAVRPGDRWPASKDAVADLTDLDPITEGGVVVEYAGPVTLNGKRYAKLTLSGTVRGTTDDGPSRQTLKGIAYFGLEENRLSYLNLKGTHELLGPDGKTVSGKVDGTFVMTRGPAGRADDLSEAALRRLDLSPTPENTQLLYDSPDLGVRFLHPRRWRVGAVQGRQVTIEEPQGGGILLTVEPPESVPTADHYLSVSRGYLRRQNWTVHAVEPPRRLAERPVRIDRFALDAEVNRERVQMVYAVAVQAEGGVTVAARLPWAEREALGRDVERILKSLSLTKRIVK